MMQFYSSLPSPWLAVNHLASQAGCQLRRLLAGAFLALLVAVFTPGHGARANEVPAQPVVAKVNINTADAKALAMGLKGVGESRAEEIVRYREAFGPFASAEELLEVKGIGRATLDLNRKLITLE